MKKFQHIIFFVNFNIFFARPKLLMDRNADTVLFKLKQHTKKVIVYGPCGELSLFVKEGYNRMLDLS